MDIFKINLNEIAMSPLEISFSYDSDEIESRCGDLVQKGSNHKLEGTIKIEKIIGGIDVTGVLKGYIVTSCSRCLKPAKVNVPDTFSIVFIKEPKEYEPDKLLSKDDLETSFYSGKIIDIEPHIWDQVLLSIPMIALCTENCEGIPYYGGKPIEKPKTDPRWDGLKNIDLT
jgi:uncharacterized metal-binding protein YceD (DUF177 family)